MTRPILGVIFGLALVAGFGCGTTGSTSSSSHHASSVRTSISPSTGGGNLDPEVVMPSTFPSDFPIYSGARLTSEISFSSNGATTWGMEWQTVDGVAKVQAFYTAGLAKDDWKLSFPSSTNGVFSATFNRKSNSKVGGILGVDGSSGKTKISVALTDGG